MQIQERYINPFTDFGFKRLFGSEPNKDLLIDFLNQILGDRETIHELNYLNTEQLGKTSEDRHAIFDLYCENEVGEKFVIELQNVKQQFFKDHSIFYSTFPVQSQAPKGKNWDYYLKAVYTIGILNFSFPDAWKQNRFIREIKLMDTLSYEVFFDRLTFIYLEVARFQKEEAEVESHFDKWMYVLKNLHTLKDRPPKLQERIFKKLFKEAEIAQLNPKEMETYQENLKAYWDQYSILETAKKEGFQEGEVVGSQKTKIETARKMKKDGFAVEIISKYTGLTEEEIEQL